MEYFIPPKSDKETKYLSMPLYELYELKKLYEDRISRERKLSFKTWVKSKFKIDVEKLFEKIRKIVLPIMIVYAIVGVILLILDYYFKWVDFLQKPGFLIIPIVVFMFIMFVITSALQIYQITPNEQELYLIKEIIGIKTQVSTKLDKTAWTDMTKKD